MIEGQRGHQKYQISILTTAEKKKRIFQGPENMVPGPKTTQHLSPTATSLCIPSLCGQKDSS